jgi:hypothetical protein
MSDELDLLEQSIDLCRETIADQEQVLSHMKGKPGEQEVRQLVALYRDLLERQLKRREELLAGDD